MVDFKFRGAQLDLARQMETIPFIKEFIDSLAANHYNYLLLYLEDRIRTRSYPYPTDHECYTPEQMRELVAYAQSRNMEIIPCVSIYGHAERFLRHPQMQDLAELHDGRNGRFWNNNKQEFCPKNEKVYQFLQSYLNEIVPLFPCQYFHIGMDEVHNIGYCERCLEQGQSLQGEEALFNTILMRGYDMLKQHGRRIMMWDDMFDHYEKLLLTLPRDIIMVGWQYQDDIRFPRSHFGEINVQDSQRKYSQLGFEYIIAPADWNLSNTHTFNDYVQESPILGGLLTSWEKSNTFLYQSLPVFAYAGQLWSGKSDTEAWEAAINNCFAFSDKEFCQLLRSIYENKTVRQDRSLSQTSLLRCSFFGNNYGQNEIKKLLSGELQKQKKQIKTELGRKIFADLNFSVNTAVLNSQAKKYFLPRQWTMVGTTNGKMNSSNSDENSRRPLNSVASNGNNSAPVSHPVMSTTILANCRKFSAPRPPHCKVSNKVCCDCAFACPANMAPQNAEFLSITAVAANASLKEFLKEIAQTI